MRVSSRPAVHVATAALLLAASCGGGTRSDTRNDVQSRSTTVTATPTTGAPTTMTTAASNERFGSSIQGIDASRIAASWRPGCPVAPSDLRLVTVRHWGFDGRARDGELVVHARDADVLVAVFERLFVERFAIEQIRLVDDFGGDDNRSMAANNTSAFNCRRATGSSRWSEHAFGRAVDINPVQNPFVTASGAVLPPNGTPHSRRDAATPGLITSDGPVVAAFRAVGWGWGGDWSPGKDYQHFSASGR